MNIPPGGDIILKIDNRTVSDVYDILRIIESQKKQVGDKVHLTILRDNASRELDLTLQAAPSQPSNNFTNTATNDTNQSPEELYNECVKVAGKSLCDFLFKK
jgi:C-terminal processing protease CtpA/Prc